MVQHPNYNWALRLAGSIFQGLLVVLPIAIVGLYLAQFLFSVAIGGYLAALLGWAGAMALFGLGFLLLGCLWSSL